MPYDKDGMFVFTAIEDREKFLQDKINRVLPLDYDESYDIFADDGDDEKYDLFVRISYTLSQMNLSLTEMQIASYLIANLAVSVLVFNVSQSDANEALMSAAEAASQLIK
jgi:hypothetical protein